METYDLVKQSFEMFVFVFSSNSRLFNFTRILFLHLRGPFFRLFSSLPPSSSLQPSSQPSLELTLVHPFGIKNLKALAYLGKKYYLCIEMSGKGSISRMSDECLMKQETVFSFYVVYQAVMRKFTLAGKSHDFEVHYGWPAGFLATLSRVYAIPLYAG